jgi:hypothetical protein
MMEDAPSITDEEARQAMAQRQALLTELGKAYSAQLDDTMGQLYNQFVVFIAQAQLPLPQVLLVLELLVQETIQQARSKYLGGN